jgi:hypothetical protein
LQREFVTHSSDGAILADELQHDKFSGEEEGAEYGEVIISIPT